MIESPEISGVLYTVVASLGMAAGWTLRWIVARIDASAQHRTFDALSYLIEERDRYKRQYESATDELQIVRRQMRETINRANRTMRGKDP